MPLLYELLASGTTLSLVTAVGFDEALPLLVRPRTFHDPSVNLPRACHEPATNPPPTFHDKAAPYEERLAGLLSKLSAEGAPEPLCRRLFVVGGQCNYLLRCVAVDGAARLQKMAHEEWAVPEMQAWEPAALQRLLDVAQRALLDGAARLHMSSQTKLIRKKRAVGLLYEPREVHRTTALMLDELAVGARKAVRTEQRTNRMLENVPCIERAHRARVAATTERAGALWAQRARPPPACNIDALLHVQRRAGRLR